jgi:hypothetical protein
MSQVTQTNDTWTISTDGVTVRFDTGSLGFTTQRNGGREWRMVDDDSHDLTLQHAGVATPVSLASASSKTVREYRNAALHGIRVELRGFRAGNTDVDATIALVIAVDTVDGDVVSRIIPIDDPSEALGEVRYPRPFDLPAGPGTFHAVPSRQGTLLPTDWPHEVDWWWIGISNTTAIYQPFWGGIMPGESYIGILETQYDGGMHLEHPAGGPTVMGPKWHPSMGTLRYARQVRYTLFGSSDHNNLVQRYRDYVLADGRLKTLDMKAIEVPRVADLQGVTIAAASIMRHTQPESHYYNPETCHSVTSFADCAAGLRRFANEYASDRVVVHLDGWGNRGYDNLHPDILPPCPEAGGWDGFRSVADVCDEFGWLFATHDNYIDFYKDAATYDPDLAIMDAEGNVPDKAWWAGGAQALLCDQNALGYVRRNFEEILRQGVKLTSTYIDVFSIIEAMECFHPDHRQTREECFKARAACFDWVRSMGIVLSSEEPTDWSIPYIDFCYWAPMQQQDDLLKGELVGLPVPLFNGTYHDCIVTPWYLESADIGADVQFLYALAFGGCPMVNSPERKGNFKPGELARASVLASAHLQTGFAPIKRHDIIDEAGIERVTLFEGGEKVHIDLTGKRYRLEGFDGTNDSWMTVPGAES